MNGLIAFLDEINYKPGRQLRAMLPLFSDPPQPEAKAKPQVWTDLMVQTSAAFYQPGEVVKMPHDF